MKKIIYISLVLPFILFSCEISPRAYFSASPGNPVVGEEVWFTNESDNAVSFEWDFGDGFISNDPDPIHKFSASGTYTVVLKAWSEGGITDEASITLEVKIPTLLEIEVLEFYQEYPVEGSSVIIYPTLTDWENETNYVNEGITDSEGKVVFSDLENKVYYVDVWETTHDNYALKAEDIGFIRTPEVIPNKINRFIAYVDVADHGKGVGKRSNALVIKNLERKATDKSQPEFNPDTNGWQVLYNKRVGKK